MTAKVEPVAEADEEDTAVVVAGTGESAGKPLVVLTKAKDPLVSQRSKQPAAEAAEVALFLSPRKGAGVEVVELK